MEPFVLDPAGEYLRLAAWEERWPGLCVGFSTRTMGNFSRHVEDDPKRVVHRRQRLASAIGFDFSAWTNVCQVHRADVLHITQSMRGIGRLTSAGELPFDAMVTDSTDILLTAFYADCVPLFFVEPVSGWIGLVHSGWRGTVQEIPVRVLENLRRQGADLTRLHIAIGPSAGPCYQVDRKVMEPLRQVLPDEWRQVCVPAGEGQWRLDLKEANRRLLVRSGIAPSQVEVSRFCTICAQDLFFSHRREGNTGRMVAWMGWRSEQGWL